MHLCQKSARHRSASHFAELVLASPRLPVYTAQPFLSIRGFNVERRPTERKCCCVDRY